MSTYIAALPISEICKEITRTSLTMRPTWIIMKVINFYSVSNIGIGP